MDNQTVGIIISGVALLIGMLTYVHKVRQADKRAVQAEIDEVRSYVDKELQHLKELHNNKLEEIKTEISNLRDELRESTLKQFELLDKLIDKA